MNINLNMKCFLVLLSITIFFYSTIGNGYILLILCLVLVSYRLWELFIRGTITTFVWIFFIISAAFSLFQTKDFNASFKFVFVIISTYIIKEFLKSEKNWQSFLLKIFYFLAFINVIATVLSVIVPNTILEIVRNLYDSKSYEMYLILFENEAYAGINLQTGTNAFFISVFIAFIVNKIADGSKSRLKYIFLGLAIVALILTQKRSFLLANGCATLVLFLCNNNHDKDKMRKTFSFVFLIVIAILVFRYLPFTENLLEKWNILEETGDISNGRFDLWKESIEIWKTSPFIGVGAGSLVEVYELSSHNVYVQVLAEMGILGAISYIALTIHTLKKSFKIYINSFKKSNLAFKDRSTFGVSIYVQVIYIIYSFFGNPLYNIAFFLTFNVFAAMLESYLDNSYNTNEEKNYGSRYINIS